MGWNPFKMQWKDWGKVAKKAAPIVAAFNPLAGAIVAGAGGFMDQSNKGEKAAKKARKQAEADQARARQYAQQAALRWQEMMDVAKQNWAANAPLRNAFRAGVMQMGDPSNPFTRDLGFAAMMGQPAQPAVQPNPGAGPTAQPQSGNTGTAVQRPGSQGRMTT